MGAFIKKNPRARRLAVELVPSFVELAQRLASVLSVPTFGNFLTVLTGWVFARRRVVTCIIQAADAVKTPSHSGVKHHPPRFEPHSAFHSRVHHSLRVAG